MNAAEPDKKNVYMHNHVPEPGDVALQVRLSDCVKRMLQSQIKNVYMHSHVPEPGTRCYIKGKVVRLCQMSAAEPDIKKKCIHAVMYLNQEPGDEDGHVGVAGLGGDGCWLQNDPW